MNSNKFDFYKNAKYFLIANGVITLVGFVMMLVLGFNLDTSIQSSNLLFTSVCSILVSLVVIFAYVWFRYNLTKALTVVLVVVNNAILSTMLICILRINVSESLLMGYILLVALTTYFILVGTEKTDGVKFNKATYNQVITNTIQSTIKQVVITSVIVAVALLLGLIVASNSMFDLVREFAVMLIIILYSYFTIQMPIFCFFKLRIKERTKVKVDSNINNQKVVKAVSEDTQKAENPQTQE